MTYVYTLSSGVEPTDDPVGPHPLEVEEIERRVCEMERSRAAAEVSGRSYMISKSG